MRELPTAEYPDKTSGVTLKCTKRQEAVSTLLSNVAESKRLTPSQATFRDNCNTGRVRGYNYLSTLCASRPVHVVFGAVDDYMCVGAPFRPSGKGAC